MLCPRKVKYRKIKKVKVYGIEARTKNPKSGFFGIKALSSGRVTSQHIESARKVISRKMQKSGSIHLRIFPSFPVTGKPIEVRMGKGKGPVKFWCFPVKPGRILFEFQGTKYKTALEINKLVSSKLPVITKLAKLI
uniref:Ribosomal protein L16 n=1 Tax=Guillardia theta TaxID=55529 RepID=A0A481WAW7_GUITH|nr:ribosomal protein L16 [Guillardia theta]QBJ06305.1 ribosomal protein L16 [Guillardia theta]